MPFRGRGSRQAEKITLPEGEGMHREPSRRRCRHGLPVGYGILTVFPFGASGGYLEGSPRFRPSTGSLGSANSLPFAVLVKPFFTSSLKIFI